MIGMNRVNMEIKKTKKKLQPNNMLLGIISYRLASD